MNLKINIPEEKQPTFFSSGVAFSYIGDKTKTQTMKFEIEKAKDGTFTTRIKVNGRVTFSNGGLNTKQAAYKKIIGLYTHIVLTTGFIFNVRKAKGKPQLIIEFGVTKKELSIKEINC